jgi:GDP-L-fucose synthase
VIAKLHFANQKGATGAKNMSDGTARREFMHAGDLADVTWRVVEIFDWLRPMS